MQLLVAVVVHVAPHDGEPAAARLERERPPVRRLEQRDVARLLEGVERLQVKVVPSQPHPHGSRLGLHRPHAVGHRGDPAAKALGLGRGGGGQCGERLHRRGKGGARLW